MTHLWAVQRYHLCAKPLDLGGSYHGPLYTVHYKPLEGYTVWGKYGAEELYVDHQCL
jgi:hypothetical protein